jgi:hypothetical protein
LDIVPAIADHAGFLRTKLLGCHQVTDEIALVVETAIELWPIDAAQQRGEPEIIHDLLGERSWFGSAQHEPRAVSETTLQSIHDSRIRVSLPQSPLCVALAIKLERSLRVGGGPSLLVTQVEEYLSYNFRIS